MNKIAICADVHLSEEYLQLLKTPLEFYISYIKENQVDTAVIDGDYFDKRLSADSPAYKYGIQKIGEIAKIVKNLIVVRGTYSHDYDSLDVLDTISFFGEVNCNLFYIKKKEVLNIDGKKVLVLPEEYPENPDDYYKDVLSESYDYIFGHGDINGAVLHTGIDNRKLKGFKFSPTTLSEISKQTVFGHIHKHQFLKDNVSYPGSLGRTKFGEEEDKGFLLIDTEQNTIDFIITPCEEFKTIKIDSDLSIEEIEEITSKYDNVKIKVDRTDIDTSSQIKDLLNTLQIQKVKLDLVGNVDTTEVMYEDIESLSIEDQFIMVLNKEIEDKKITMKNQNFFNEIKIKTVVNKSISEVEEV